MKLNDENANGISKRIFSNRLLMTTASFLTLLLAWFIISGIPGIKGVIIGPEGVFKALWRDSTSGMLFANVWASLVRVFWGFLIGFTVGLVIAFLMGWYKPVRVIVEPWVQFFRTIPPIALIPLVIVLFGIGTSAKISIIALACFLLTVITTLQGVVSVDSTLIKAAMVLGINDRQIFFRVVLPASTPFILVAMRLGIAASLTTLIAAELTGSTNGLGNMIMEASTYFNMDVVMEGILVIGIIGFVFDKFILFLERKLTGWLN